MSTEVAPALSTAQAEQVFEFDQHKTEEIKQRHHLPPHNESDREKVRQLIRDYYSIDELAEFLHNRFAKITLQFPDSLVCDSSHVVQMLQESLNSEAETAVDFNDHGDSDGEGENCATCMNCSCGKKETQKKKHIKRYEVWVLADTSYSPCCIDEVAAEHVGADVVVHFGDTCLTPIQKLPSVYVLGKPYLSVAVLVQRFREQYPDKQDKIMLMADASHTYCLRDLYLELKKEYPNVAYSEINNQHKSIKIIGYKPYIDQDGVVFGNRRLVGVQVNNTEDDFEDELNSMLQDYQLFHITLPESPRLLFLTTKFSSISIYDPATSAVNTGPFPSLMRRYRYMHVARTAGTIGILVNTLSLDNTKKMVNIVAKWIKDADKKYYMFVVGKPNVAKLANFDVIDIWCILGCGQSGIIIDQSNEYYKPIVTPYELHLALTPEVTWTGKWITGFKDIINIDKEMNGVSDENKESDKEAFTDESKDSDDEYAPEFNAVTGKYVSNSRPLRQIQHLQIELGSQEPENKSLNTNKEQNQLVQKFSQAVSIKGDVSTSAIHLQNRHWTGLGSDFQDADYDDTGAVVEEGRAGIARGYAFDTEAQQPQ